MEVLKEAYDALTQRVRSPFAGSILLVFFAVNWKPLWFLFFSEGDLVERFDYFDANTTDNSLYWIPLAGGFCSAVALPWLRLVGAKFADPPTHRLKTLQKDSARRLRIAEFEKSADEQEALARLEAAQENRKIASEVRLQRARELSEDLSSEIEQNRNETVIASNNKVSNSEIVLPKGGEATTDKRTGDFEGRVRRVSDDKYAKLIFSEMLKSRDSRALLVVSQADSGWYSLVDVNGVILLRTENRANHRLVERAFKLLVKEGVVEQTNVDVKAAEYEYSITPAGFELQGEI